jgi:hypothetical protein
MDYLKKMKTMRQPNKITIKSISLKKEYNEHHMAPKRTNRVNLTRLALPKAACRILPDDVPGIFLTAAFPVRRQRQGSIIGIFGRNRVLTVQYVVADRADGV